MVVVALPKDPLRQAVKGIDGLHAQRFEMALIPRQEDQVVSAGRRRDDDVGKSRRPTLGTSAVRERTGDSRFLQSEGENALAIEMQQGIKPRGQSLCLAARLLATQLGYARLDFGD